MFDWLKRKTAAAPAPLTGAPPIRRQKSYSGMSGYVYQYYYEGWRPAALGPDEAAEYVFSVTSDRKTVFPVSVFVLRRAVGAWQAAHLRQLSGAEQYAIAKMALFAAFDERDLPAKLREPVVVEEPAVDTILTALELD